MLHGYGDNAANFMHLAQPIDKEEWQAAYVALNAPGVISGNYMGYQWFDLYPNGIYISEAGPKEFEKINKQLKSLRDADNKEIKKYLAEINIDKQLQKYDEKRRGDIDKFLNNYTAAITKKIKNIKNQIDLLMKGQLLGSEDEDTEVQPSSDDDGMNVEELQQRVDDILKF